ncbi:MAG: zinc-dependent alcohol dehydrogenase family protein [Actinobacteria bacterium]|nr:MAG: zinc-dependent alcohol dehydrogenase family protein [Actinomycetota bacterium]TML70280.1 MAG: zinc-dependent alcohol dehydrogenase family protein [Actinomycetota bacterium]
MRAQVLHAAAPVGTRPLRLEERTLPEPAPGSVRVRVSACGCCRTDLHVVEGDLELPHLPVVPGHQVVGVVEAAGDACTRLTTGRRVGVAWLHRTDQSCAYCRRGEENLCEAAEFTGWTVDGGYADAIVVPEDFAVDLPDSLSDLEAAPLLCAGVIGYRALRRAEVQPGDRVALLGFGASAHLAIQVLHYWGCEVFVLTRGESHRDLARELGAAWVGDAAEMPPERCDRAVVFAPAGELVPVALDVVRPGGTVSLAGIHMTPIPSFDYERLWRERSLRSVANMTRRDAEEFMALAATAGVRTSFEVFPLEAANDALVAIRSDAVRGAAVLDVAGA